MVMNYFDGINFIYWGNCRGYTCHVDCRFKDYYGIQYNHEGIFYQAQGEAVPRYAEGSHAFITFPGMRFRYGPAEDQARHHLFVCFNGPRAEQYLQSRLLVPRTRNPLIKINRFDRFYLHFRELTAALANRSRYYPQAVNLLETLLLQLDEEARNATMSGERLKSDFEQLAADIGTSPSIDWDFRKEASRLNLSYPHFRRLFDHFLGCAPGQYLLRRRLSAAAEMLRRNELTIAEIAERQLFCDIHHFSKMFHKYYLMPPARFRQECEKFGDFNQ